MVEFLEAFDGYVPSLAVIVVVLVLRKPLTALLNVLVERVSAGSEISVAGVSIGAANRNTSDAQEAAKRRGEPLTVFGNPDQLKLLFKVQGDDWKKSTKALEVPGGCLVQMTTERVDRDGNWSTSEALQYVPQVRVVADAPGEGYTLGEIE